MSTQIYWSNEVTRLKNEIKSLRSELKDVVSDRAAMDTQRTLHEIKPREYDAVDEELYTQLVNREAEIGNKITSDNRDLQEAQAKATLHEQTQKAKNKQWIAATICPIHNKPVFLVVSAPTQIDAENDVKLHYVDCPWGKPQHLFAPEKVSVEPMGKYTVSSGNELKVRNFPYGENVANMGKRGVLSAKAVSVATKDEIKRKTEMPTNLVSAERHTIQPRTNTVPVTYINTKGQPVTVNITGEVSGGEVIRVTENRADQYLTVIYSQSEVRLFDRLMTQAKASPQRRSQMRGAHGSGKAVYTGDMNGYTSESEALMKDGLIALLLVHSAVTATQATGFLQAAGLNVNPQRVREQLSRLEDAGIIYEKRATYLPKPPLPNSAASKEEKMVDSSVTFIKKPVRAPAEPRQIANVGALEQTLGEHVFYMNQTTRQQVLQQIQTNPAYQWWNFYQGSQALKTLNLPLRYTWIKIPQNCYVDRFKSKADLLTYGPYKAGAITKVPLNDAVYLQNRGAAVLMNPQDAKAATPTPKETTAKPKSVFLKTNNEDVRTTKRIDLVGR